MGDKDLGSTPSSNAARGVTLEECQQIIQKSFSNPKVKFLVEKLEKSGCKIGSNSIRAVNCEEKDTDAYSRERGIVICSNHLASKDEVETTLIHKLIHAYDDCHVANLDWDDTADYVCSEIRANHLSGICNVKREFLFRHFGYIEDLRKKLESIEEACVKQRSMRSLPRHYSPAEAKSALEVVWSRCYNDTEPFNKAS